MEDHGMYGERAALYDRIYHFKDYAAEARRVTELLHAAGVPDGSRVLEAACGTGNYLVPLSEPFRVSGLDIHRGMLDVARAKVGDDVSLLCADMREFELDSPVDAVVCLFSSIGYVRPEGLARALAAFHRAPRPGGVLIVEPWIAPEDLRHRSPHMQTYHSDDMHVARACTTLLDGRVARMDFHWLVATSGGVEHFTDRHEMWCSTKDELLAAFDTADFDAHLEDDGLCPGRGLVIGTRRG